MLGTKLVQIDVPEDADKSVIEALLVTKFIANDQADIAPTPKPPETPKVPCCVELRQREPTVA